MCGEGEGGFKFVAVNVLKPLHYRCCACLLLPALLGCWALPCYYCVGLLLLARQGCRALRSLPRPRRELPHVLVMLVVVVSAVEALLLLSLELRQVRAARAGMLPEANQPLNQPFPRLALACGRDPLR